MWIERGLLLAALWTLWPGAGGIATALETDLEGRRIHDVQINCDQSIDDHTLRKLLPFQAGDEWHNRDLEEARRILKLKESFRTIDIEVVPVDEEVDVVITLTMRRLVGTVRVYAADQLSGTEVRRLVRLFPGSVFEPKLVDDATERLRTRYNRLGYVHAEVTSHVEPNGDVVDVRFDVDEGQPIVIGRAMMTGVVPSDIEGVTKELDKIEGKPYGSDTARTSERALRRQFRKAGFYEARIKSSWQATANDVGVLTFAVTPGPKFVIDITGNTALSREKLLGTMDLNERLLITDGTWRELGKRMTTAYQEAGYPRATVKVTIERGDPKEVHFAVDEGREYHLRHIRFRGNQHLSAERLRDEMATQTERCLPLPRSGALVDSVLDDDLKRLWYFYREQGFESAQIVDARPDYNDQRGTIDLTIVVDEGPQTIVREIKNVGLDALADSKPVLKQRVDKPLNPEFLKADQRTLVTALGNAGYGLATVQSDVARTPQSDTIDAVLTWQAQPGMREEVGQIIVQGNIETRDRAILRELPFKSGDPLDPQALLKGQGNIYKLGIFRLVSVRPLDSDPNRSGVRDVAVRVVEGSPGRFEWGTGFNTRDGFVGFGEVSYANLFGMARKISLRGQGAVLPTDINDHQYLGSLTFTEPRLGQSPWSLVANVVGQRTTQTIDPFKLERVAVTGSVFRELWPRTKGELDVQWERADLFDVKPDVILRPQDQGVLYTTAPSVFMVYDQRDDPFNPRNGSLDSVRLRYGFPGLSTLQFFKVTLQHSQYISLTRDKDVWLLFAARGGWGRSFEGSPVLPIRERFFLGGSTTVRGFAENSIGPTGDLGDPIGGDLAINLNAELDFPLVYGFGGATFVDGGGVYLPDVNDSVCVSSCGTSLENFRRAAGLGLRYLTPVGPISLDYGFKLDRRTGESIGEVSFSIGAIF